MKIKDTDTVVVEYEGKLETGEVFDSSRHGDHVHYLIFKVGSGHVIKGFNDAVIGMNKNEEKEITLKNAMDFSSNPSEVKNLLR